MPAVKVKKMNEPFDIGSFVRFKRSCGGKQGGLAEVRASRTCLRKNNNSSQKRACSSQRFKTSR